MEIQALCIRVTDDDAAAILQRVPEEELPAREMRVTFTSEGIAVEGKYPAVMLTVPFRMVWRGMVQDGMVRLQMLQLDFYGLPAGPLRGLILGLVRDELQGLPGVSLENDLVEVDVSVLLSSLGVPVAILPREILHEAGSLTFLA